MRHRPPLNRPLLALCVGLLAAGALSAQPVAAGPLDGVWKLNLDLSDHVGDKLHAAMEPGAAPRGPGRKMGRNGRPDGQPPDDRELFGAFYPVIQLVIHHAESSVALSDAGGQLRTYTTNGRKVKETILTGEELETSVRWKDEKLTIEKSQHHAGTARETYSIDPASGKLILLIKLNSPGLPRPLEFRRVYDRVGGN